MRKVKRTLVGLLILATFYLISYLITSYHPRQPSTQVLSAVTNISMFSQPETGRKPIIDAINNARKSIKVEVYLLSDKEIISALEQAKLRGVDVRVILERHPFGGGGLNPTTKENLEKDHIPVHWSNPEFALTHEKSIVIDDRELLLLDQNLTASSFSKNREYDIFDRNPQDVKEVVDIFEADWQQRPFTPTDSHLIVSPVNSRQGITNLIQSATREIDIEVEVISDKKIVELLIEKSKTVKIKLLTPTVKQISSNKNALISLANSGIEVHTMSSPYIHAKLITIDESIAYTGSINLSTQSMDRNRELGIIISQKELLQDLSGYFHTDWDNSTAF